jgi:hypothetical protein
MLTASTVSSSRSRTATSGGSSTHSQRAAASLPPSLQEWVIPPGDIEYLRRPDGSLCLLGEGAG